ncbi:AAA family ATPase [Actinomyces bouchesdurhonensis]|uniref:AAA family ATPase n=1 Tax=Actinomyces bouchesdurhonensis TaxID=1852361 RepID=UPI0028E35BA5|nr:AAA family ATPase [Actinomyces bouchesdurhonensis]
MKLTHIALTNWRNFAHIEFDLASRLFVVGPNSSGKTNLLAALRFLSDVARFGLAATSERWGGTERYFRSGKEEASFSVTVDVDTHQITYNLSLWRAIPIGDFFDEEMLTHPLDSGIPPELMRLEEPWVLQSHGVARRDSFSWESIAKMEVAPPPSEYGVEDETGYPVVDCAFVKDEKLVIDGEDVTGVPGTKRVTGSALSIRNMLSGIRYIHPNPKKMLERADRYDPDHGTGFFQHAGRFSDRKLDFVVKRIRPIMAAAVPEVPNLSYQRMGLGTEVVFYSDTPVRGASGVYSHEQFSEGTLRLLGMLFDLATLPRATSIVLIEEPETFLQASVVRSLPSLLAEVAMNRDIQMVISTHSPELIDSELVLPSQVLMLRSKNDATTGELLSQSNDPRIRAVVGAGLPKSQGIDAVNGRTIPLGTW